MAVRKSTRTSAAAPDVSAQRKQRDRRGKRGYRMHKNGLLNVTSIGDEIAIKKNSQDLPLLRLPAEIRSMIWEHALGGQKIRLGAGRYLANLNPARGTALISFQLLCVCRQIYAEAALLPRVLNTPCFRSFTSFLKKSATGQLHNMRKIGIQTSYWNLKDPNDFERLVPASAYDSCQSFDITLSDLLAYHMTTSALENKLTKRLAGKNLVVRFVDNFEDMDKLCRDL